MRLEGGWQTVQRGGGRGVELELRVVDLEPEAGELGRELREAVLDLVHSPQEIGVVLEGHRDHLRVPLDGVFHGLVLAYTEEGAASGKPCTTCVEPRQVFGVGREYHWRMTWAMRGALRAHTSAIASRRMLEWAALMSTLQTTWSGWRWR